MDEAKKGEAAREAPRFEVALAVDPLGWGFAGIPDPAILWFWLFAPFREVGEINQPALSQSRLSAVLRQFQSGSVVLRSMKLDFSSLEGAANTLERSVKAAAAHAASIPRELQETVRSGIIQNFEVAYELSWKMIKRWLESNVGPGSADGVTRRELFRLAAENRLLEDVDLWMRFHNARNESSHSYDNETAEEVSKCAVDFAPAARALLSALCARND